MADITADVSLVGALEIETDVRGVRGESAYEVAVRDGFVGTEEEWLASLKGEQGERGEQGIQGVKGDTGATGPKGDKGEQGERGPQGEQGVKGDTGAKGDKGDPGADGQPGAKGDKGDKGDTGAKGDKGDKGDTGATGVAGAKGDDGFSPTVSVTDITGGHRVAITDASGSHTFDVMDGDAGSQGTMDYTDLTNKPSINNVTLSGNKSLSDLGIPSTSSLPDLVADWMEDNITDDPTVVIDSSLSVSGAAADAKKTGDEIADLKSAISGGGLTDDVKDALLALFEKVVYIDDDCQDLYDALEVSLYPPAALESITAVFTQGQNIIYDTDSLDILKQYLVVTAVYEDQSAETISSYNLSGTLEKGTSTITVSYGGKTTTFSVVVSSNTIIDQDVTLTGGTQVLIDEAITYDQTATYSFQYTFGAHTPVSASTTSNRAYGPKMANGNVRDGALQYNGTASEWRYVLSGTGKAFTPSNGDKLTIVHNFASKGTAIYLNDTLLRTDSIGPSYYSNVGKIGLDADNAQMTIAITHIKIAQGDLH